MHSYKKFYYLSCLIFYCLISCSNAFAINIVNDSTLTLTIINHTNSTLTFTGITNTNPGNTFNFNVSEILPGGATTMVATTSEFYGIAAKLRFEDEYGHGNLLEIMDPNQLSSKLYGKFIMNNNRFVSFIKNQTLNSKTDPRSLAWTTATVEIQNKLNQVNLNPEV